MSPETFDRTSEQAATSLIGQLLQSVSRGYASAWNDSWVRRVAARATVGAVALNPERRLRLLALIVAWSCAWQLLLLPLIPKYSASALPRVWAVAAGVMALTLAVGAGPLTRAWPGSVLRTILVQPRQKV